MVNKSIIYTDDSIFPSVHKLTSSSQVLLSYYTGKTPVGNIKYFYLEKYYNKSLRVADLVTILFSYSKH